MHSDEDEAVAVKIWGERKFEVPDLDEGRTLTMIFL